jgi:hypothetical protein
MNAIILKGAALRQTPLPQSGPRVKTIAHPRSTPYDKDKQLFSPGGFDRCILKHMYHRA